MTGDEPMTGASYPKTLCEEVGEPFDPDLTLLLGEHRKFRQDRRAAAMRLRPRAELQRASSTPN